MEEILVPNMSCKHCIMRIAAALKGLGIKDFKIVLEEKKIYIKSTDCKIKKILEKLEEIDYPAVYLKKQ